MRSSTILIAFSINCSSSGVIVISLGSPYIGNEYFERVKTYINTYSNDASTHSALLRILLGQLPFKGKSPVNLEHKLFTF